ATFSTRTSILHAGKHCWSLNQRHRSAECTNLNGSSMTSVLLASFYLRFPYFTMLRICLNRYFRSRARINPTTTYVFPRTLGGGVILGGSRQDNDWSAEW